MNRRELLQLGACGVAAAATVRGAPADSAGAWRLCLERCVHELAPGLSVPALALRVLERGPARRDAPVVVDNAGDEPVWLRSASWDQDLSLAGGARGACRMNSSGGEPVIRIAARGAVTRARLSMRATTQVDASFDLPIHHWAAHLDPDGGARLSATLAYRYATLGTRLLAASEPLRVREGQRVRLRFFNASPSRAVSLHLPGHHFEVCAVDERPLPTPLRMDRFEIAPGERIETAVAMRNPGRWVLGSLSRTEQQAGFGRLIEYTGARGRPVRAAPQPLRGAPAQFALPRAVAEGAANLHLQYDAHSPAQRVLAVTPGAPIRLLLSNGGTQPLSLGVRGHRFELRQWNGVELQALHKDLLALPPFTRAAIDLEPRTAALELLTL